MTKDNDPKRLLDKSIEFIRELSAKVQQEASKTWKISDLRFEIAGLKKKRNEKLRNLGEKVLDLIRKGRVQEQSLRMLFEEICDIEEQIVTKDEEAEKIESEFERQRSLSRSGVEVSQQKGIKGDSMAASKSSAASGDRSRKILASSEEPDEGTRDR